VYNLTHVWVVVKINKVIDLTLIFLISVFSPLRVHLWRHILNEHSALYFLICRNRVSGDLSLNSHFNQLTALLQLSASHNDLSSPACRQTIYTTVTAASRGRAGDLHVLAMQLSLWYI